MVSLNTREFFKKYYIFDYIFDSKNNITYKGIIIIVLVSMMFPMLNYIGSFIDGTLFLPENGKGLFQHYGIWAFFISTPIIFLLTIYTIKKFINLISILQNYTIDLKLPLNVQKLIKSQIKSISLKTNTRYILLLFMIIGFMFSIVNIIQTINPLETFGNDVYDAYNYTWGFIINKFHLCILWVIIYPITIFILIHIYLSILIILRKMYKLNIFRIDVFSEDGCGGVSCFGLINLMIMSIYMCIFCVIIALKFTHTKEYFTINFPMITMSIFFIIHNFIGVYYLHKLIKTQKNLFLNKVNSMLNNKIDDLSSFSYELLLLRNHIISIKTYPYSKSVFIFINLLKFSPSIIAVVNYIILTLKDSGII